MNCDSGIAFWTDAGDSYEQCSSVQGQIELAAQLCAKKLPADTAGKNECNFSSGRTIKQQPCKVKGKQCCHSLYALLVKVDR
jgi:hypothetical protein